MPGRFVPTADIVQKRHTRGVQNVQRHTPFRGDIDWPDAVRSFDQVGVSGGYIDDEVFADEGCVLIGD
jgi:sugar phosphate isomerase/epimerase